MQTISKRITDIKKQLDELEGHVNSTLSILDCQRYVLNEYPKEWKEFKWKQWNSSYYGSHQWQHIFKNEEETIKAMDRFLKIFEEIHIKNKVLIQKNTETFNKICAFLVKLGFSMTTYAHSGTGKRRHSYQTDSDWVAHLRSEYFMVDVEYNSFTEWYKKEASEVKQYFTEIRRDEQIKQQNKAEERRRYEEQSRREEEQAKAINLATEYLVANGKVPCRDFNNDTAIDCAFKLKMENLEKDVKKVEEKISKPETINALDRMEL